MILAESNSKERLAEIIGHELRNPLASAVASLSVSLEMTDGGDPRSTFLNQALDDLSRVSTLLTSYLDFGRSGDTRRQEFDMVEMVRRVRQRSRRDGAEVNLTADSQPILVRGSPALMERLVENLIENALSMGATSVDLHVDRESDECVLRVADNGPGVPETLRDRLFDPFVSGRGSSGMGLSLARDIVASHGGHIALMPSGGGATFRVTLPAWSR